MKVFGGAGLLAATLIFTILSASDASSTTEISPVTEQEEEEKEDGEEAEEDTEMTILPSVPDVTLSPEEIRCDQMIGEFDDSDWVGLNVSYDLQSILAKYGGPPGKVNATWEHRGNAPVESDPDVRPLPDADDKYWLYNYTETDNATWRRSEHAVHRFSGTEKEFLEVRGNILWTPEDFCGKSHHADYVVDDRGFTFVVSREYCRFENDDFACFSPPETTVTAMIENIGLYASLVGGG